jgi:hypothetical protein
MLLRHLVVLLLLQLLLAHRGPFGRRIGGVMTAGRLVVGHRAVERAVEGTTERAVERAVGRAVEMAVDGTAERAVELAGELAIERAMERTSKRTTERTIETHRSVSMGGWWLCIARPATGDETWRRGSKEAAIDAHVGGTAAKVVQIVQLEGWDAEIGGWCVAHLRKASAGIVGRVAPAEARRGRHGHVCHAIRVVEEGRRNLTAAGSDLLLVHKPAMCLHQPGRRSGAGGLSRAV